ncbi:MAG: glycosyltransferase family 39 protein [Anaerolineae bacterium]|nr:glycosyltransferase family 39 protein [Anaerolineae bacterium]
MGHTRRQLDIALLLIPALALVALWPLLTQSLPSTDDGALHMLRLSQLDRCLRHGGLCLRWAPDFAHGYGYPGFNYYMNMPTLLGEGLHLTGLNVPQSVAGGFVLALLVSGWGAYLLARDLAGRMAGLVAATAYVYAPYQFYDVAYRGNLPETWALALLPWVLWTARRAALRRRWATIVPFGVAYAALIWSHNIYALIASLLVGAYLALLWWQAGRDRRDALRLGAMVLLGLALGAFFWVPAFFERGWTRYSPHLFDYASAFLPLRELLSLPPQHDISLLNAYPPRSLSWGMLLLCVAGGLGACGAWAYARRRDAAPRARRFARPDGTSTLGGEWAFYAAVLLVASFLTLPASAPLYRLLPPLQLVQMPWRFLGLASLAGSVCAGWAIGRLPGGAPGWSPRLLVAAGAIVLLIATAVPWTYAAPFPQAPEWGVDDMLRWEYDTGLIGGTSANEFLPVWSAGVPSAPADPAMLEQDDPMPARLEVGSLPEGARVIEAQYGVMGALLRVDTPVAFRAEYRQFYFPGWRVQVDGRATPLYPSPPWGLLSFDVPAGEHEIVVRPAPTALRAAGTALTALAALCVVGLLVLDRSAPPAREADRRAGCPEARLGLLAIAALALVLVLVKEGLIDRTENVFHVRRYDGAQVRGIAHPAHVNLGDVLTLVGYDLPRHTVVAGDPLRVDLYLSAQGAVDGEYMAYARVVDDDGRLWSLRDNGTPDGFRPPPSTEIWSPDAYGHWSYLAYTLPGTPPGAYWVEVAVFEAGTWRGLNVIDASGQIAGLTTRIGPVEIRSPRTPPTVESLVVSNPLQTGVAPSLECLGSTQGLRGAQAGDLLEMTLFWRATGRVEADYRLDLSLVDAGGAYPLGDDLPLGREVHPTSRWRAGEVVRSPHALRIPAAAPPGRYAIEGRVVDAAARPVGAPFPISEVEVEPTDRVFALPPGVQHRLGAALQDRVLLAGYDLPRTQVAPGDVLHVTLYWQAVAEMPVSYKAFVQLVGPGGVLSQVDAVPVGWTRPTTGWVAGEVVADPYALPVPEGTPPGTYALIAGMYEEQTMQRLQVLDPAGGVVGDYVQLGEIAVR